MDAITALEPPSSTTARSTTLHERQGNGMDAFTLGVVAVARSGHPVKALNFFLDKESSEVLCSTLAYVQLKTCSLVSLIPKKSLRGITALSLHIGIEDLSLEAEHCEPLETLLRSVKCLERLELSFRSYENAFGRPSKISDRICRWLSTTKLQHLTLYSLAMERATMQRLLSSQRSPLRLLELLEITLSSGACWLDMLVWIAQSMPLNSFRSYMMMQDDGELFELSCLDWEDYCFTGTETIKKALQSLAQRAVIETLEAHQARFADQEAVIVA